MAETPSQAASGQAYASQSRDSKVDRHTALRIEPAGLGNADLGDIEGTDHQAPARQPDTVTALAVGDTQHELSRKPDRQAFDHEAEAHQGNGGALPGEQGALGGEQDLGVVEAGHRAIGPQVLRLQEWAPAIDEACMHDLFDNAVPGNRLCGVCPDDLPQQMQACCQRMSDSPQGRHAKALSTSPAPKEHG